MFQAKQTENTKPEGEEIQYSYMVELDGKGVGRPFIMKNIQLAILFALLWPHSFNRNVPFIRKAFGPSCFFFPNHCNSFMGDTHSQVHSGVRGLQTNETCIIQETHVNSHIQKSVFVAEIPSCPCLFFMEPVCSAGHPGSQNKRLHASQSPLRLDVAMWLHSADRKQSVVKYF